MRRVERLPARIPRLERTDARDAKLRQWLQFEVEAAFAARRRIENVWREARRQYEGIPRLPVRTNPIPNMPNIEVTVGATAADAIYAQAVDALFTASPLMVVRATNVAFVEHAKAMQDWVNWMVENEVDLRNAVDNAFLDDTQLGTAAYYIPFVETKRKTDIERTIERRPQIIPIAPEHLVLPGGTKSDIQDARWAGLRFFYTPYEVRDRARANPGWDISKAKPVAQVDLITAQREEFGNLRSGLLIKEFYEFIDIYAYYDYDEDGEDEDLLITYDRSSQAIVACSFNPYDKRPIEVMRYQARAHQPYGMGIMEMAAPYQEETTELHNHKILNAILANSRMWLTETGSGIDESFEAWPSKVVTVNDITKFQELKLSDVFPQLPQFEMSAMGLAEQRIGLSGQLSLQARGGSRTPATTALSLLQQTNRRFTPAFDSMRLTTAAAVQQSMWRYAERAKLGDRKVHRHFVEVLGADAGERVWEALRMPDFASELHIEFTAASAIVSRETDRQNSLLLLQVVDNQHQRVLELITAAAQPGAPEPLRRAIIKQIEAKNEMLERALRTFDMVRDPHTFIADVTPELEEANAQAVENEALEAEADAMLGSFLNGGVVPQPVPGIAPPPPGGPPGVF